MTIADAPGFQSVDVTQLDATDPADLVDLALDRAATLVPGWVPREGNVEVVLLEEFAVIVALLAQRLEVIVPAVTMQILGMSGLTRDEGTAARISVDIDVSDTLGHVVPAGTQVVIGDPNADEPITGTLLAEVSVPSGSSVGSGTVVADEVGVVPGLTTATDIVLIDAIAYVDTITATAVVTAGTDPETDAAYLDRGSAWLASMTQMLGRPEQIAQRALTDLRVGRALGVQRWDGSVADPGTVAGAVTVLVLGAAGQELDAGVTAEVQAALELRTSAELDLTVQAPVVSTVAVTASLVLKPGYVASTVQSAVAAAVASYLSPLTWPWGEALNRSRLLQVIETVAGVSSATISAPAADVPIGSLDLLQAGTITITAA